MSSRSGTADCSTSSAWGKNQFRAQLNVGAEDPAAYKRFDEAAARLAAAGGGLISIYYHPTEFVTTEFWDGVNFAQRRQSRSADWVKPRRRTAEDSERCYGVLRRFVQHMKTQAGVRFVTASDLPGLYAGPQPNRWIGRRSRRTSAVKSSLGSSRARCSPPRTCCSHSWASARGGRWSGRAGGVHLLRSHHTRGGLSQDCIGCGRFHPSFSPSSE